MQTTLTSTQNTNILIMSTVICPPGSIYTIIYGCFVSYTAHIVQPDRPRTRPIVSARPHCYMCSAIKYTLQVNQEFPVMLKPRALQLTSPILCHKDSKDLKNLFLKNPLLKPYIILHCLTLSQTSPGF